MKYFGQVLEVEKDSIAYEAGIKKGDIIAEINGNIIKDELDFRFYACDDFLEVLVIKEDGSKEIIEIEEPDSPNLGISFESALFGNATCCANKCIFCFIDQMPKGMRDTLYFKDDDSRLSFLTGNYVTLTNTSDKELDKVIKMRLEPVNVSVHTTNPKLRVAMLKNRRAANIMQQMKRLSSGNIEMNCQIVLVSGYNDKEELDRTLKDLSSLSPMVKSVSVVPVGITKFRDGLCDIKPITKEESDFLLEQIETHQKKFLKEIGTRFVYAADEFYIKSGKEIPVSEEYEGYPQIENGVGMIRSFYDEFCEALNNAPEIFDSVTVVTGMASNNLMIKLSEIAQKKYPGLKIEVSAIKNNFFGENVTVSGLITGGDIIKQLRGKNIGKYLILPENMLRAGTNVLLDDITTDDLERELNVKVKISRGGGYGLWSAISLKGECK